MPSTARAGPSSSSTPAVSCSSWSAEIARSRVARYRLVTPWRGWDTACASSPSVVSTSSPRLSASSRPTGTRPGTGSIEVHDGAALIRIAARGDHADRLVEDNRDGNCPSGNPVSVDDHPVQRRVDDRTEAAHLAVDRDPSGGDELVGAAPRGDASAGEKSVQPLRRSGGSLEGGERRRSRTPAAGPRSARGPPAGGTGAWYRTGADARGFPGARPRRPGAAR